MESDSDLAARGPFTGCPPTPFRLGVDAYRDGVLRDACPVVFNGYDAQAWLAGWDIGERVEQQERKARVALMMSGRPA